jgi:hypothetical protein
MKMVRRLLYFLIIIILLVNIGCSYSNRRHNLKHYRQLKEDIEEIHKTIDSWVFDIDY